MTHGRGETSQVASQRWVRTRVLGLLRRFRTVFAPSHERLDPAHSLEMGIMQLEETRRLAWYTAIPQISAAIALRFVLHESDHRTALTFMLAAVSLPALAAMGASSRLTRPPDAANVRAGHAIATVLAAALGAAWSILPLVFLSSSVSPHIATVVATVAGLISIVYVIGPIASASMLFMLPLVCATFVGLCLGGSPDAIVLCLLLLIYAVFTVVCRTLMNGVASERFVARIEARESRETIALLLRDFEENASDWLWETDAAGRITYAPVRFLQVSGMEPGEALGRSFSDLLIRSRSAPETCGADSVLDAMRAARSFVDEVVEVEVAGRRAWWRLSGKPFHGPAGFVGFRGVGADVTEARTAQRRIADLAETDHLTGLPNRSTLARLVEDAQSCVTPRAFLYLDLDRFKLVNDESGHAAGDALLKMVAARIVATLPAGAVCARLSGDEFAVWLPGGRDAACSCAAALGSAVAAPFLIAGRSYLIGVSIGIALAPEHAEGMEDLQAKADLALYHVKRGGKSGHQVFEAAIEDAVVERRTLEADLALALVRGEFELHYQPLVDARNGRIVSFEALVRWSSPDRGSVAPGDFIPVAEQCGLIVDVGRWVLMRACCEACLWPDGVGVAVNVSPRQFREADFAREVAVALEVSGLKAHRLEIEITEGVFIEDAGEVHEALRKLRLMGVKVAIDDFGTGFSSLSYIARYAVDRIKIDKSFVQGVHGRKESRAVVEAIVALATSLSIRVTAEGVETEEQASYLRRLGCDDLQGFLFGRPGPAAVTTSPVFLEAAHDGRYRAIGKQHR